MRHLPVLFFAVALPAIAMAGNNEYLRNNLVDYLAEEFQKQEFLSYGYTREEIADILKDLKLPVLERRAKPYTRPDIFRQKKIYQKFYKKLSSIEDQKFIYLYEDILSTYKKRFRRSPGFVWRTDIISTILIYRKNFLNENGYRAGKEYMIEHFVELARAEAEFGIPKEILTAVLWVETGFAGNMGKHSALKVLFRKSIRESYRYHGRVSDSEYSFRRQLFYLLFIAKQLRLDVRGIYGSSAAALGMPQFLTSSYRHYAIDGDEDGAIDLFNSHWDAIFSIANYLKKHGWDSDSKKSVWRYNNSRVYVFTIFEYAENIKE